MVQRHSIEETISAWQPKNACCGLELRIYLRGSTEKVKLWKETTEIVVTATTAVIVEIVVIVVIVTQTEAKIWTEAVTKRA